MSWMNLSTWCQLNGYFYEERSFAMLKTWGYLAFSFMGPEIASVFTNYMSLTFCSNHSFHLFIYYYFVFHLFIYYYFVWWWLELFIMFSALIWPFLSSLWLTNRLLLVNQFVTQQIDGSGRGILVHLYKPCCFLD